MVRNHRGRFASPAGEVAERSEVGRGASFPQLPINGLLREGRPSSVTFGDSFSLRAKCRLRRLRFDTRLRAQPCGEAF